MSSLQTQALARHLFPFLSWWPRVTRATLRADLLAGLVGALVVLPQGVAFATLAGMPPEYGLYCAMVPAVVAALWGSSWHAVTGPTNAVSLVVFATLAPLAAPGSPEFVKLALTLAFMSGAMMLALGALRLGSLVNFISHTVVVGFTAGAACLIIASQLRNFFGIEIPRGASFLQTLVAFFSGLPDIQPWTLAVGVVTIAGGIAGRRLLPQVHYMITAMLTGSLFAFAANAVLGTEATGIRLLGALPGGVPPLSYPEFSVDTMRSLLGIALTVTVLSLTEAMSIARSIAARTGQRIDGNQEFIGQGLANIAASFFSAYPAAASFNRSGLNAQAGARTPLASVFAALILFAVVVAVAPLAAHLPIATMAGILLMVGWDLIDRAEIGHILRVSRNEAGVLIGTFLSTLLLNLDLAILVGVMISLFLYLHRTSQPRMRSMVPDPRHPARPVTEVRGTLRECPQVKILRIEGSIYFGAVAHVERNFDTLRSMAPDQRHLLLLAKSINFVDLAGAKTLAREAERRAVMGGALWLCSPRPPVEELLARGGYLETIGESHVFRDNQAAIAAVARKVNPAVCERCTARIFRECAGLPGAGAANIGATRTDT